MVDISTYKNIRAYIESYVLGDSRLHDKAFVWGPDKRLLDKQASTVPSPFFWVSDYRQITRSFQSNTQIYKGWELKVEVKGAVGSIDKIVYQENMMEKTLSILSDFILFLIKEHNSRRINFNLDARAALPDEGYELEGTWGWEITISILSAKPCNKFEAAAYSVYSLIPVWNDFGGDLTVSIEGNEFTEPWTEEKRESEALFLLAKRINESAIPEIAFTNGFILYIRSAATGTNPITLDLETNNEHSWSSLHHLGN